MLTSARLFWKGQWFFHAPQKRKSHLTGKLCNVLPKRGDNLSVKYKIFNYLFYINLVYNSRASRIIQLGTAEPEAT
jgi:hypothetical protein